MGKRIKAEEIQKGDVIKVTSTLTVLASSPIRGDSIVRYEGADGIVRRRAIPPGDKVQLVERIPVLPKYTGAVIEVIDELGNDDDFGQSTKSARWMLVQNGWWYSTKDRKIHADKFLSEMYSPGVRDYRTITVLL